MVILLKAQSGTERKEEFREIVLFDDTRARASHKTLFSLDDACYIQSTVNILESILGAAHAGLSRLHISAGWENMLKIAIWTSRRPMIHEALAILKKAGLKEEDLMPFLNAQTDDLFPWLYYGKRFDILRKICLFAKTKIEANIDTRNVLVYCHLVSAESETIIAGNL